MLILVQHISLLQFALWNHFAPTIFKISLYLFLQAFHKQTVQIHSLFVPFIYFFLKSLSIVLLISSWFFVPLFLLLQPFSSSGSNLSFSVEQYISSEMIPVRNFHISGRQVIGLKFSTEFPFTGSFWHSTVLPYVIQDGISFVPSSISFNWVAILSCILSSLFIQNPWTPSCPDAFLFGILLHCFFTLSSLITTLCWSNFTITSFRSLNHLASLLCSFSTLHITL